MAFPRKIEGEESWLTNLVEQLITTTKMEEQLSRQDHLQTRMSITPPEFWTVRPVHQKYEGMSLRSIGYTTSTNKYEPHWHSRGVLSERSPE